MHSEKSAISLSLKVLLFPGLWHNLWVNPPQKTQNKKTKTKMKPGKERPASSCFRIQGLRSGTSPKKWGKSKTLGAGMFPASEGFT
jgi:hypothetical protein